MFWQSSFMALAPLLCAFVIATQSSLPVLGQSNQFQIKKRVDSETPVPNQTSGIKYLDFGLPSIHRGTVGIRSAINQDEHRVDKVLATGNIVEVITTDLNGPISEVPRAVLSDVTIYNENLGFSGTSDNEHHYDFRAAGNTFFSHPGDISGHANSFGNTIAYARNFTNQVLEDIFVAGGTSSFLGVAVQEGDPVPQENLVNFNRFGDYLDHTLRPFPFNSNLSNNGSIAFFGLWDSLDGGGLYRWQQTSPQSGTIIRVADRNVQIPNQSGTFDSPSLGNRLLGFETTRHENVVSSMLFSSFDFQPESIARPSLYGTTVAFSFDDTAFVSNGRAGVYTHNNSGQLSIVADVNTPHPTLGGTFDGFEGVSTVGAATAFIGNRGGVNGLYLKLCNKIYEIVREGISFDETKVVSNIEIGHRALAVSSPSKFASGLDIVFRAEFTDGSEGIYTASIDKHCAPPLGLIGNALKPFDPTDPDDGPIGGLNFFTVPIYDDGVSILETSLQATSTDGTPVIFGGDISTNLFGVEGVGANDDLIDFAVLATGVVAEQISVTYNQPVQVDSLHLEGFGPDDSALIQIGGQSIRVLGTQTNDGMVELPGIPLLPGEFATISWDPLNVAGNGFSYNGMLFTAIPEPASATLWLIGCILTCCCLRRSNPSIMARWSVVR